MSASRRSAAAIVAFLGMVVVAISFSVSANAAPPPPYHHAPSLSVNKQNPPQGGTEVATGTGFAAGEVVHFTLKKPSKTYALVTTPATVHASASGGFTATLQLPAGVSGPVTITATGSTGDTASVDIKIGGSSVAAAFVTTSGTSAASTGGGLTTKTGAVVMGVGGLGAVLLVVRGFVLWSGRRRKVSD